MDAQLLGWVASAVFLTRLLPQPVRLIRTGVPDGVSPLASLNASIADAGWLLYGLHAGLPPVWVVSGLAFVPSVWTTILLARRIGRADIAVAAAWAATIVAAYALGRPGTVLALSVLVSLGPQLIVAIRRDELRGLAPATWIIALADAALWGTYGAMVGDGALVAYAVVLSSIAVVILGRIVWTRRHGGAPTEALLDGSGTAAVLGEIAP